VFGYPVNGGHKIPNYTNQQLILAARLYYLEGMSQAEIATFVRVSQPKISRMLAIAQQRGIVRISVPEYESRNPELEKALAKTFSIDAVVIHSIGGVEMIPLRRIMGYFAASVVGKWIKAHSLVVLSGGRAVQALVEQMQPVQPIPDLRIATGMGHIDSMPGPYDASELCRDLARRWQGSVLSLNGPLIFPDEGSCQEVVRLPQIQEVLRAVVRANVLIFGVGAMHNSLLFERDLFTRAEIGKLADAGAVGEVLGRFYNAKGVECQTTVRNRTLSIDLAKLRGIARRIAVVVGVDRTAAVLGAIRGKILNTLVTEESCAEALLRMGSRRSNGKTDGSSR
jgi:DNA-binding transcriptional regulator LsrR (DeoR family)